MCTFRPRNGAWPLIFGFEMRLPHQWPNFGALDWRIRSSLFESTVDICFANQPSGILILKPHFPLRKTFGAEDLMTCGILDLDGRDPLRVSETSGKSKLKYGLLLHALLPGAVDLMTPNSGWSTTQIDYLIIKKIIYLYK